MSSNDYARNGKKKAPSPQFTIVRQKRSKLKHKVKATSKMDKKAGDNEQQGSLSKIQQLVKQLDQMDRRWEQSAKYFHTIVEQTVGLRKAQIPFNCHPDLMRRFIRECFGPVHDGKPLASQQQDTKLFKKKETLEDKPKHMTWKQGREKQQDIAVAEAAASVQLKRRTFYWRPAIRLLIESAHDLPAMDAADSCDPYFKVFSPSNRRKCIFISSYINNTRNPVWNVSILVPVRWKDICTTNSRIHFEAWDKDPSTLYEAAREFRHIRSFRGFRKACKDLYEAVFSKFGCVSVDDRVGEWTLAIDEVPATGVQLRKPILASDKQLVGTVQFSADWAAMHVRNRPKDMLLAIQLHLLLYVQTIKWHLEHALPMSIATRAELDINRFLYMPALTLINQHRVQRDLSWPEDCILKRCALLSLITKNYQLDVSNAADFYKWKLALSCMLANEELGSLTEQYHWAGDWERMKQLEQFEIILLERLHAQFIHSLPAVLRNLDPYGLNSNRPNSSNHLEFLHHIRTFANFDTRYPQCKLREKVNNVLAKEVVKLTSELLSDIRRWEELLDSLEQLDECLLKHWSEGLAKLLRQTEAQAQLQTLFKELAAERINQQIQQWQLASTQADHATSTQLDRQLMRFYVFTQRIDHLLLYCQSPGSYASSGMSIASLSCEKMCKDPKVRKHRAEVRMLDAIDEEKVSQAKLELRNLCLGELYRFKSGPQFAVSNCFPSHLMHHWLHSRSQLCIDLSAELAEQQIKQLKQQLQSLQMDDTIRSTTRTKQGSTRHNFTSTERYYFEAMTATLYLFVRLQFWEESLFETSVVRFCECIQVYVRQLIRILLLENEQLEDAHSAGLMMGRRIMRAAQDESLPANAASSNVSLMIFGLNEIYRLDQQFLLRLTVEMLTDREAYKVWQIYQAYKSRIQNEEKVPARMAEAGTPASGVSAAVRAGLQNEHQNFPEDALLEEPLPALARAVLKLCSMLDQATNEIQKQTSRLITAIGSSLLHLFVLQFRTAIEVSVDSSMSDMSSLVSANAAFQTIIKFNLINISGKTNKLQLLTYIKVQLDEYLRQQFIHLLRILEQEEQEQSARRHLTKMQLIRLTSAAHNLKQSILQYLRELHLPSDIKWAEFEQFFIDSDDLEQSLQPILFPDNNE